MPRLFLRTVGIWTLVPLSLLPAGGCSAPHGAANAQQGGNGSYAVVVSRQTWEMPQWRQVVDALRTRHDAAVIVWPQSVWDARAGLSRIMPRYACFVARPEECGRDFVVAVHRMTRQLDDDPYEDLIWGIVTGYNANDALRLARRSKSLIVRRALGGCGSVDLDEFDEGIKFDEGQAGERFVKPRDGRQTRENWAADSTKGLVDALNDFKPDAFYTSGHASEHDWRIGYNYPDGSFRCKEGQLYGLDTHGQRFDVHSPNSKVYLAMGNCLIGHIPQRDCMALAYMHSAGVDQMIGYTAVTFFGFIGWGVNEYFEHQGGRFTLAESFYAINAALVHELESNHPRFARINFDRYGENDITPLARQYKLDEEKEMGLVWDRDIVAFYGDPAWEVRRPAGDPGWASSLVEKDGQYTLSITATRDCSWGKRPVMVFLPRWLEDIHVTDGETSMPVVTDNFVLLRKGGVHRKGDEVKVVFRAKSAATTGTSASESPIMASVAPTPEQLLHSAEQLVGDMPVEVPHAYRARLAEALSQAGGNVAELTKAVTGASPSQREAVCFLIVNMPTMDLRSLTAAYLLDNATWAYKAREAMPWGKDIPDELFLNDVLPYASINERRDNWRKDFYERCSALVRDCHSPGEAAQKLNRELFPMIDVKYHATRRAKPYQSPYESISGHYASCTGLSVLLIDACRAVCVPARLVGTPQWSDKSGNHSWVEVWDKRWHFTGAAEPDAAGLDRGWFVGAAAKADTSDPLHRIYATSFQKTDISFPMVWDIGNKQVSACDVTAHYAKKAK